MQRTMLVVAVLALAFAACGGGGAGSTPEDTFEAMKAAAISKDGGAFYDLLAPADQEEMAKGFEEMKEGAGPMIEMIAKQLDVTADELKSMSPRDYFAVAMEKMGGMGGDMDFLEQAKDSKIVDSKIEGDKATLTVETAGKTEKMEFVQVDGKWYMSK